MDFYLVVGMHVALFQNHFLLQLACEISPGFQIISDCANIGLTESSGSSCYRTWYQVVRAELKELQVISHDSSDCYCAPLGGVRHWNQFRFQCAFLLF